MSILKELPQLLETAEKNYNRIRAAEKESHIIKVAEIAGEGAGRIIKGDNLRVIAALPKESVKLVYIDPPFFSNANYKVGKNLAYTDIWNEGEREYLLMLAERIYGIRDILSQDGSVYVHLDWHIAHYVRIIMDEIFGPERFINEIIWTYKSGGSSKRHFARKHDTILFYSKSDSYELDLPKEKSYNRGGKPYRFKGVSEYQDEFGWYTMVNMKDVWQIDMVGRTSRERTGYATQKPEALVSRIIEASSSKGDTVCDFFGGSGTLAAAAGKSGRKWISCDIGEIAVEMQQDRLKKEGLGFVLEELRGDL